MLPRGDGLQMGRVDASGVAAFVMNMPAVRDRTHEKLVGESMGWDLP